MAAPGKFMLEEAIVCDPRKRAATETVLPANKGDNGSFGQE